MIVFKHSVNLPEMARLLKRTLAALSSAIWRRGLWAGAVVCVYSCFDRRRMGRLGAETSKQGLSTKPPKSLELAGHLR